MMTKKTSSLGTLLKSLVIGKKASGMSALEEEIMMTPFKTTVKNFRENRLAMLGLIVFTSIFLICFIVPIFLPLDTTFTDATQSNVGPGYTMMAVPSALSKDVNVIAPGATFGAGLSNAGHLYIFGQLTDAKMANLPSDMGFLVDISAGNNHLVALNDQGEVFAWGYDRLGVTTLPPLIDYLKGNIIEVDAGYQISWLTTDANEVLYWGNENLMDINYVDQYQGQIADFVLNSSTGLLVTTEGNVVSLAAKASPTASVPEELLTGGNVVEVAMTERTAAALTADGQIIVWGERSDAAMTLPDNMDRYTFVQIEGGLNHYSALTKDGQVISWGADNYGQSTVPSNMGVITELYTDYHQNYAIDENGNLYSWGLKGYLMGTDGYGRDIFVRLVSGGRMTITVGAIAVIISTIIGIIIGGIAGYHGGTLIDNILMRFAEIVNGLPVLPFAMILSSMLGNSVSETGRIMLIMVILGLLGWTGLARLVRAQILAEREKEFVTAAKAIGVKEAGIIFKHIIPNIITIIIVSVTLSFASSMLTESTLSFLGFGVTEPNPTWGNMLTSAQDSKIIAVYWWQWVFPALALSLATISINSIGDGLRDATDPHSNDR